MPRLVRAMPLAFEASQKLDLPVKAEAMRLPDYLQEEERVLGALLDSRQLTKVSPGHYSYLVTSLQVFQLQVKPVVALQIESENGTLRMRALDCVLEGADFRVEGSRRGLLRSGLRMQVGVSARFD